MYDDTVNNKNENRSLMFKGITGSCKVVDIDDRIYVVAKRNIDHKRNEDYLYHYNE